MRVVLFSCLLLGMPNWSSAVVSQVIYDNFGSGNAHRVNSGRAVLGAGYAPSPPQMLAVRFVTGFSGFALSEVDVAGKYVTGSNSINVSLATDSSGSPSASMSLIGNVSFPGGSGDPSGSFESVMAPAGITLTGGAPYWIVLSPGTASTDAIWDGTTAPLADDVYKYNFSDSNGWQPDPSGITAGLRVIGTPLPEPGVGLMAIGMIWGLVVRRDRATRGRKELKGTRPVVSRSCPL